MQILRVSETLSGAPLVEIDQAPLDASGTLHVSDELAKLLGPYMEGRDNISVRFMGNGLPTTVTAVITEMYAEVGSPPDAFRWYSVRAMIFATPTDKTGMNVYFQPTRVQMAAIPVQQHITDGPIYNFREVYEDMDDSANDMERLLNIADNSFSSGRRESGSAASGASRKRWWNRLLHGRS